MKRLRAHGLIKKIGHTYKYYLTALGKQVTARAQAEATLHHPKPLSGTSLLKFSAKFGQNLFI